MLGQNLGDGGSKSRFSVINVTNGTDVQMGTISDELGKVETGDIVDRRLESLGSLVESKDIFEHFCKEASPTIISALKN